MSHIKHHKIVNALPAQLEANAMYFVRKDAGFEVHLTNSTGIVVAYPANYVLSSDARLTKVDGIEAGAQVNVATNIAQSTRTTTSVVVTSSTGTDATLLAATTSLAGVMTAADKSKLDGVATGAQVNTVTSVAGKTGAVALAKGDVGLGSVDNTSDVSKPVSTAQQSALDGKVDKVAGKQLSTEDYSSAEKTKLAGVAVGAQVNDATNLAQGTRTATGIPITSSTGTGTTLPVATTTLAGLQSAADKTKLDGITGGATANATDAELRDRSTHTGMQALATVTGLEAALDEKVVKVTGQSLITDAERTKLSGIAAGAQVNSVTSVAGRTGAVTLAKADVGLSNVDNTSDASKPVSTAQQTALDGKLNATANAVSASKLATARSITLTGDVTGSVSFDGSANATITAAYKNTGVAAGTYTKVTVDAKGNVTGGGVLAALDVPTLNQSTTGNAATATKLQTARSIALAGDVTGSATFDGSANVTITATVVDDSHAHVISNVDGLQAALDGKLGTAAVAADSAKLGGVAAADVYQRATILGTVAQLNGVPTGAIIERGSNANGEYVRFADGTQICTAQLTIAADITSPAYGAYWSSALAWTYPALFAATPRFVPTPFGETALFGVNAGSSASAGTFRFGAVQSTPGTTRVMVLTAIGRWF